LVVACRLNVPDKTRLRVLLLVRLVVLLVVVHWARWAQWVGRLLVVLVLLPGLLLVRQGQPLLRLLLHK
jgi:hypothetical protein